MSTTLQKITLEAKRIRKAHPNMKWTAAVKAAGAKYRGGKISGIKKKKTAPAKKRKRISGVPRPAPKAVSFKRKVVSGVGSISTAGHVSAIKNDLKNKLGAELAAQHLAAKKMDKRKHAKKVADIKKKLRSISGF